MSEQVLEGMVNKLSPSWRRNLEGFLKERGDTIRVNTKINYAKTLLALGRVVPDKDLKELSKDEVVDAFSKLQGEYAASTVNLYKVCAKRFFRWLYDMKKWEYPPQVSWIEIKKPRVNGDKMRENIVTEEEIMRMVKVADHPRDKALVSTLYESAAREGEMRTLRNKDIKFDKFGAVIMVAGKTGVRPIRLVNSAPYLQAWMNVHPQRENPDVAVWTSSRRGKGIGKTMVYRLVQRLAKKAGIKKKVHPHVLRHSRLTKLATLLKEPEMRNFSGWTKDSSMPAVYVHLSGRDIDKRMLEISGVKEALEEKGAPSPLEPKVCPRCQYKNPADSKYCARCSLVLDLKTALELDQERQKIDDVMTLALDDPEVQKLLLEKAKALMRDRPA